MGNVCGCCTDGDPRREDLRPLVKSHVEKVRPSFVFREQETIRKPSPVIPCANVFPQAEENVENPESLVEDFSGDEQDMEIIDVEVPPGPLGLLLDSEHDNMAVVDGFTLLPDGTQGQLELDGRVQPGDVLTAINGMNVTGMPLEKVIVLLQQTSQIQRVLTFTASYEGSDYDSDE